MKLAGKTDIGSCRSENQDNYRAARLPDDTVWAVVCDGMGGAASGQLAAQIATDTMESCFESGLKNCQGAGAGLSDALRHPANRAIYDQAQAHPENKGMGTTAVCCLVRHDTLHVAHVATPGLSLPGGQISQLTRDHSMVQELVEAGRLTTEEAENYPHKNLITKALGVEPGVRA